MTLRQVSKDYIWKTTALEQYSHKQVSQEGGSLISLNFCSRVSLNTFYMILETECYIRPIFHFHWQQTDMAFKIISSQTGVFFLFYPLRNGVVLRTRCMYFSNMPYPYSICTADHCEFTSVDPQNIFVRHIPSCHFTGGDIEQQVRRDRAKMNMNLIWCDLKELTLVHTPQVLSLCVN